MFELRHDFGQYNNYISRCMDELLKTTGSNFRKQAQNGELIDYENELTVLTDCIGYFEEYLYYNYQKFPNSFNDIIKSIFNNVKLISLLPKNNRGIYGYTYKGILFIKPNLTNSRTLEKEERTRLYIAHELGHAINASWMEKVKEYANQQLHQGRLSLEHAQLIYDGFSMLDEATAQNRAENFVYEFSKKQRPNSTNHRNGRLFSGETYKSNFDFYGELQEPAIMFARTLRGIGKEDNDIIALNMLSERALNPTFFDNILKEYSRDGQMQAFVQETQNMGYLKRAAYANFGQADAMYLYKSKEYLDKLKDLTARMRDYREPFGENR